MRRAGAIFALGLSPLALGLSLLALGLSLLAPPAHAAAPSKAMLERIDAVARAASTLSAEFTQKNRMRLFKQELSSKGRLLFRAPRQIRWEYLSPDPSLLILDGATATMSSPGAAPQVFDLNRDATMRAIFDQLLTFVGGGSISRAEVDYEIAVSGAETQPLLSLTPRTGGAIARTFSRIELQFDERSMVKKITLREKNGDEKEIVFGKMVQNAKLPERAFDPAAK